MEENSLSLLSDAEPAESRPRDSKRAVVLAGGRGVRLAPYTTVLPKPLLPLGDGPILDLVIRQLHRHGFTDITLAVGYLAHVIENVFRDGAEHGVSLRYHHEPEPLGTAGALATIEDLGDTFLMMNGDVLTTLDFGELYAAHAESGNALTVATYTRSVTSEYGVLDLDDQDGLMRRITGFREKPRVDNSISMGVYVVESRACRFIEQGQRFDVPDLIARLLEAGERVGSYAYDGFWIDIGRHEDYILARDEFARLKDVLMPSVPPMAVMA